MNRFLGLTAAVMIATGAQARAASSGFDVQALYALCTSGSGEAFCLGYIEGIGHFMAINAERLQMESGSWLRETSLCSKPVGSSPSGSAMKHAFMGWAAKHRRKHALGAAAGVVLAFRDRWPCRK